jgi:hypothetical protein
MCAKDLWRARIDPVEELQRKRFALPANGLLTMSGPPALFRM